MILEVESLDLDANGVARHDGKVVFVRGALPGEQVRAETVRRKPKYEVAQTVEVLRASALRVTPRCPHFSVCGGCSMQHLDERAQVSMKQRVLEDQLAHLGGVKPTTILRPIAGAAWRYRYRARLSVRDVPKKGGVLVGFHERASRYVADMTECHVLPQQLSDLLVPLRRLVERLSMRTQMPQIEVAQGDEVLALVFRVLVPPSADDLSELRNFESQFGLEIWLQSKGPDTITLLTPARGPSRLAYDLPEFGVRMPFRPTDFTQVNHQINRILVKRAVDMLDPQPGERVADLFCGLGNFSLPIARRGSSVVGIEGSPALVARARENAAANGLQGLAEFRARNLFVVSADDWLSLGAFERVLIDPPREGAAELVKALAAAPALPRRIVYVSCNPSTLARDAAILCHQGRYELQAAGVVNMFPQTSHVESMAVFERQG